MPKKIIDSQPQLIDALKTNNETLQNIDRQFMQIMSKYHIYFFHEAKPTDIKGTFRYVRYQLINSRVLAMAADCTTDSGRRVSFSKCPGR